MAPLWDKDNSWSFSLLKDIENEISDIAINELGLSIYPNQIEIITSEQMLDAYTSLGLPVMYNHWSFGKYFSKISEQYKKGDMGLAYELVINSNPCISYLMEENTMTMQALVIAHAAFGHNSFFKNNYMFKQWTQADFIIDYLLYAKKYIAQCEERYGFSEVEAILDATHNLRDYGIDKYPRAPELSKEKQRVRDLQLQELKRKNLYELETTLPKKIKLAESDKDLSSLSEQEENILFFIEKNSPILEDWQREIIRIIRTIAQYLYPQRLTKVSNEGFASFIHYTIMNRLYDKDIISEGAMLEFMHSHSNVLHQPNWSSKFYSGINPYTLGFNIFSDIKRICTNPDNEDKLLYPDLCDENWVSAIKFAMENFKDESLIMQYLSPKIIKKMKLFGIHDYNETNYEVKYIHNQEGHKELKKGLSRQYGILFDQPELEVIDYRAKTNRSLHIRHTTHYNCRLGGDVKGVMSSIKKLWGYPIYIYSRQSGSTDNIRTFSC